MQRDPLPAGGGLGSSAPTDDDVELVVWVRIAEERERLACCERGGVLLQKVCEQKRLGYLPPVAIQPTQ